MDLALVGGHDRLFAGLWFNRVRPWLNPVDPSVVSYSNAIFFCSILVLRLLFEKYLFLVLDDDYV